MILFRMLRSTDIFKECSDKMSHPTTKSETTDMDDASIIDDDVDEDVDVDENTMVDVEKAAAQKPHFLDYDPISPSELEETIECTRTLSIKAETDVPTVSNDYIGENFKLDKKFERDGEISDFELAASGYTKKEFTQEDNTIHLAVKSNYVDRIPDPKESLKVCDKSKHFLDENPIAPDYMISHESREHRSLDRNFERQNEYRSLSSPSMERKSSLDPILRSSRENIREPIYTFSRFLDSEEKINAVSKTFWPLLPKGQAWTQNYDRCFNPVQLGAMESCAISEIDKLGPKVECVYSLLSMLGSNDSLEMSKKFLELSQNPETCTTLRRSGCIPLLVQIMNADVEESVKKYANLALHNVVHSHPDEKAGRREAKVLRLLDQLTDYCNFLKTLLQSGGEAIADDSDRHPLAAISSLMKVSFDEEHRHAMCELGALQVIPGLVHLDHAVHGPKPEEQCCNSLRRYALMALTNLTFGDENNKALLCSQKVFMEALVVQLESAPDDLLQVTASVLRNLSWRADSNMKAVLNEIGTVTALAGAAMKNKSENTLKAILSALWNLSAHCSRNKAEFCAVEGALAFLVNMLTYEGPSKTLKIIENAGGILRNVSSHVAVRAHYREILRERNCLAILLQQLKSESLTVVSNACGTLWNLSARCPIDQKYLWDNGAVPMLRSLIHSKHAMISEGSSSALKNLLNFKPSLQNQTQMDHIARSMGLKKLPTLTARKQRALEQELGAKKHNETCDNLDVVRPGSFETNFDREHVCNVPSIKNLGTCRLDQFRPPIGNITRFTRSAVLPKSESRDSIFSTKSDSVYENSVRLRTEADVSRKAKYSTYAVDVKNDAFTSTHDVEHTAEQPIDYAVQFKENIQSRHYKDCEDRTISTSKMPDSNNSNYTAYQETDIDQPTDFSLLYAENQVESDADISPPDAEIAVGACGNLNKKKNQVKQVNNGNEILLILEDSVKCYQTEDTPYVISNAASVTDLHQNKAYNSAVENIKTGTIESSKKSQKLAQPATTVNFGSGTYTPEKPINYCEEGTPIYFSRYESLSSLNESPQDDAKNSNNSNRNQSEAVGGYKRDPHDGSISTPLSEPSAKDNSNLVTPKTSQACAAAAVNINENSAQETPLMFSRHSSMDSLADDEDVCPGDDKSSVVSDFSRLASGIISPSDIPDSPTQSIPQSPGRTSGPASNFSLPVTRSSLRSSMDMKHPPRLRSVFEDDLNTFHVENTPAQFSCATSLSNLHVLDDHTNNQTQQTKAKKSSSDVAADLIKDVINIPLGSSTISEGEEEAGVHNNDDDLLLANCINIGMSRTAVSPLAKNLFENTTASGMPISSIPLIEMPTEYCTEDTPAFLSKVGSNTNLSSISISSNLGNKDEIAYEIESASSPESANKINLNRHSLNLSNDVSSNASDVGGEDIGQSSVNILQQCIRDGMKKSSNATTNSNLVINGEDPVEMMRRGGTSLPIYLPVSDEINKFIVEDTPCNFSVMSALSNLTVGSSLVGPAIQIKGNSSMDSAVEQETTNNNRKILNRKERLPAAKKVNSSMKQNQPNDSLSSLSIDSEDDTNLLSQAIAAGYNRPKSNLGFSSSIITNSKRSSSLTISQPVSIHLAPSTSLTSLAPSAVNIRRPRKKRYTNDSYSSVDSSDSNDNQSKSLFELCILTGMNKRHNHSADNNSNKKEHKRKTITKPESKSPAVYTNVKRFDSTPGDPFAYTHHPSEAHSAAIQLERERKDEQLLMECINTGISRKIGGNLTPSTFENARLHKPIKENELISMSSVPKNAKPTSAAVLEPYHQKAVTTFQSVLSTAAPDVGQNTVIRMITNNRNVGDIIDDQRSPPVEMQEISISDINTNTQIAEIDVGNRTDTGYNPTKNMHFSNSNTINNKQNQSLIIKTTNIFYEEKHKNPDLMLRSVERLTQEFVSSAEYLRTNGSRDANDSRKKVAKEILPDPVSSNSNNTWNDDTSPYDISFPSISISAPLVQPFNCRDYDGDEQEVEEEEEETGTDADQIEMIGRSEGFSSSKYQLSPPEPRTQQQLQSLYTDMETLDAKKYYCECNEGFGERVEHTAKEENGINFRVGGEVQNTSSTYPSLMLNYKMNNSTIIAMEARHLADNFLHVFQEDRSQLSCSISSLDLDNVRPPSGMESLNISGYYEEVSAKAANSICSQPNSIQRIYQPQSPNTLTRSPKFPRKSLPTGLVARRALGQFSASFTGSAESVNSSCVLLDNIKPPSLMDELLDSMISVESIQSEIVDCDSLETTVTVSNYDTANTGLESDDNTVTLQSCYDAAYSLEKEEDTSANSCTLFPSDCEYSSWESTPKNTTTNLTPDIKQSLTPKEKRKISKDRFKTYTIVTGITSERHDIEQKYICQGVTDNDDRIEIENQEYPNKLLFMLRNEIEGEEWRNTTNQAQELGLNEAPESPAEAKGVCTFNSVPNKPGLHEHIKIKCESNSVDDDCQNSETESSKGYNKIRIEDRLDLENETIRPRIVKPGSMDFKASNDKICSKQGNTIRGRKKPVYISPYKMQHQRSTTARPQPAPSKNASAIIAEAPKKSAVSATKFGTPPLERQGTFVKEEASNNVQVPVVDSTVVQPVSPNRISKLPTKKMAPSPKSTVKVNNLSCPAPVKPLNSKLNFSRKTPTTPQRSNSNASLRLNAGTVRSAVLSSRISSTTPPSRSNSNLNCGSSNTVVCKSAPTTRGKLSQARSRIACIWKSVDEVKNSTATSSKFNFKPASSNLQQNCNAKTTTAFNSKKNFERTSRNDSTPELTGTAKHLKEQKCSPHVDRSSPSKIAITKQKTSTIRKDSTFCKK